MKIKTTNKEIQIPRVMEGEEEQIHDARSSCQNG